MCLTFMRVCNLSNRNFRCVSQHQTGLQIKQTLGATSHLLSPAEHWKFNITTQIHRAPTGARRFQERYWQRLDSNLTQHKNRSSIQIID